MEIAARPSIRPPDLIIVLKEHRERVTRAWPVAAADSLVEVLSEDSVIRNRREKYLEYQMAGVREYLWVEDREGRTGFGFVRLDHAGIYQPVQLDEQGRYHSEILPGSWF